MQTSIRPALPLTLLSTLAIAGVAHGQELYKLRANDPLPMDRFGSDVDVHGDRIVVGAAFGDGNAADTGAAYVFDAAKGRQLRKLIAADGELEDFFGSEVALTETRALVSAPLDLVRAGSAYVFDVQTGQELMKLSASDGAVLDTFGSALDMAGSLAAIASPWNSGLGAVYVFDLDTGEERHKLVAPGGQLGDFFGSSVSTDGMHVAVGDYLTQGHAGAAYVFDGATGSHIVTLRASDSETLDGFGFSIAIHGERVVVGAPFAGGAIGQGAGVAYVFDLAGQELFQLVPDGVTLGDFGWSVAISDDRIVVGDPADGTGGPNSGALYVFDVTTGQQLSKFTAADPGGERQLGSRVALDGYRAVAGAQNDVGQAGSVYEFLALAEPTSYCTPKTNSCGTLPRIESAGAASATACAGFTIRATNTVAGKLGLLLYSDSGSASVPFQGGLLCVDPSALRRSVPVADSSGQPGLCDGELALDMNAFAAGLLGGQPAASLTILGTEIHGQYWGRDKSAANGSLLSDAIEFVVGP